MKRQPHNLLEASAAGLILAVLACRCFIAEMPFRLSQVLLTGPSDIRPGDELFRVGFALLLLIGVTLWAASLIFARVENDDARAAPRRPAVVGWWFFAGVAALAAWSLVSAVRAIDVRGALEGWLEQVFVLLAGWATLNLVAGGWRNGVNRRWGRLVVVLAALGGAVGVKALFQHFVEIPMTIEHFNQEAGAILTSAGINPGTAADRLFQRRLMDPACTGFFSLSNILSSLLIVTTLAGIALAVGKFVWVRRASPRGAKDERVLAWLSVAAAFGMAGLSAVALVLARSKGGTLSAVIALLLALLVIAFRGFLGRHRRAALAVAGAALVGLCLAGVAYGLAFHRLPGRSLEVRWEYWVGGARMLADRPMFGVGAGNFGDAYLPYRLSGAEETPKSAHNLLVDSAASFGLPGAAIYLVLLAWMLAAATKDQTKNQGQLLISTPDDQETSNRPWFSVLLLFLAVMVARWLVLGLGPVQIFADAAPTAIVFAAMLLAAMWLGPSVRVDVVGWWGTRVFIAAALVGMLLHNLVEYSLWTGGTATVFWVTAGAAAGLGDHRRRPIGRLWARALTAALAALGILAAAFIAWPTAARNAHLIEAQSAAAENQPARVRAEMEQAIAADPLDAQAPFDLARWLYGGAMPDPSAALADAQRFAQQAFNRSGSASNAKLLADVLWSRSDLAEWVYAWHGASGDLEELRKALSEHVKQRGNPEVLNRLAEIQCLTGHPDQARQTLTDAIGIARMMSPGQPPPAKLYDNLGQACWQAGDASAAGQAWREYVQAFKPDACLSALAIEYARKAVALDPNNMQLRMDLAERLLATGDVPAAGDQLRRVRQINDALPNPSDMRLADSELSRLKMLEGKARLLSAVATSAASR